MTLTCSDCLCAEGELHELFCLKERCPFCSDQLASCECISAVLTLTEAEQEAVDDYIDDEEEPLKSVILRWTTALNQKGRVPFSG